MVRDGVASKVFRPVRNLLLVTHIFSVVCGRLQSKDTFHYTSEFYRRDRRDEWALLSNIYVKFHILKYPFFARGLIFLHRFWLGRPAAVRVLELCPKWGSRQLKYCFLI